MKSYREFDGGYARTDGIQALIEARCAGDIGKNELRLFFAKLEHVESGKRAPVDVILNKRRKQVKRMTEGQQEIARERLAVALSKHEVEGAYHVKLPRKFVRAAARGVLGVSEMITALCYFQRRMPQRSKRKCLVKGERYGRLSVRTVREATGLCCDVIVKALRRLREAGLIALIWRPMVEVKRFGRLFVDGVKVSISYHKPEQSRASSPSARSSGRPNTSTVPTENPNRDIKTLPKNSFNRILNGRRNAIEAFASKFCPDHKLARAA